MTESTSLGARMRALADRWDARSAEMKEESAKHTANGDPKRALVCWSDYIMFYRMAGELRSEVADWEDQQHAT